MRSDGRPSRLSAWWPCRLRRPAGANAPRPYRNAIPEPGAVAVVGEPVAEHGPVRAVLRAGHVPHVGLPPSRVAAALQPLALAAPDGGRVLVAVVAVLRRDVLHQSLAAFVGAGAIDEQPSRPASTERSAEVSADVRVFALGEDDPLYGTRLPAFLRLGASSWSLRHRRRLRSSTGTAGPRNRSRRRRRPGCRRPPGRPSGRGSPSKSPRHARPARRRCAPRA